MAVTVAHGVEGVQELVGRTLGPGEWATLSAEQVTGFLLSAGPDPGPDGVVPPYLLLSLVSRLAPELLSTTGFRMGVNYGCDQVRFPAAAPVGARLRASLTVDRVDPIDGGAAMWSTVTIEAEGVGEPVLVAVTLVRRYV
ncbi:dehydratase [Modestobacter sp. I12A-02628]|uniref:Dehydratase n=1 Tax=Goekera deserti TaxID=2497753 RepID=A0A7K3WGW3_9ACTN|nr:dehydratase [Goekera deserti]MPQ97847.1 dehydratase [Goekera deserti]NDI48492.1 dehydratase [Goekera deserti]NEL55129.1 dehydratase [Goekera deserti]